MVRQEDTQGRFLPLGIVMVGTSLLLLSATCGGLFTSCHLLPHVGEQSALTRSAVRSISPAPVTRFPFPIYSGLCPLSVSVCLLCFVLPCT